MASVKKFLERAKRADLATLTGWDPRRAKPEPSERIRGSSKNPPGSATVGGTVRLGDRTMAWLRKQAESQRQAGPWSVSAQTLAKVYRRGAGAFSSSHYPGMSRDGWARARVSAFRELLTFGRPANPRYVQDNDLLPPGHPAAK